MNPLAPEVPFVLPALPEALDVTARLVAASVLGGVLGYERELEHKAAGLRTHMLVALGSALFVLAARHAGMTSGDVSRVIQGIATGIGFVGGGTILKSPVDHQVKGLTTATGVWITAAIGIAVGVGTLWLPILGTILALLILTVCRALEPRH